MKYCRDHLIKYAQARFLAIEGTKLISAHRRPVCPTTLRCNSHQLLTPRHIHRFRDPSKETQTKRRLLVSSSTAKRSSIAAAFAQLILNVFLSETLKSRTDLSGEAAKQAAPRRRLLDFLSNLELSQTCRRRRRRWKSGRKEDGRGREEETSRRALEASQFFSGIY